MKWYNQNRFIRNIAEAAVQDWQDRNICLPSVTIALAIEGTCWGMYPVYREQQCLFPRRHDGIHGYSSMYIAVRAHNTYLATWRAPGQQRPNWENLAREHYILTVQCLQAAEYPYSPDRGFERAIVELIERYDLNDYDECKIPYNPLPSNLNSQAVCDKI